LLVFIFIKEKKGVFANSSGRAAGIVIIKLLILLFKKKQTGI